MTRSEIMHFEKNKIARIERIGYEVFNVNVLLENRKSLVDRIDKNYPEFNRFSYNQT